jgi:hypothetical protein
MVVTVVVVKVVVVTVVMVVVEVIVVVVTVVVVVVTVAAVMGAAPESSSFPIVCNPHGPFCEGREEGGREGTQLRPKSNKLTTVLEDKINAQRQK